MQVESFGDQAPPSLIEPGAKYRPAHRGRWCLSSLARALWDFHARGRRLGRHGSAQSLLLPLCLRGSACHNFL